MTRHVINTLGPRVPQPMRDAIDAAWKKCGDRVAEYRRIQGDLRGWALFVTDSVPTDLSQADRDVALSEDGKLFIAFTHIKDLEKGFAMIGKNIAKTVSRPPSDPRALWTVVYLESLVGEAADALVVALDFTEPKIELTDHDTKPYTDERGEEGYLLSARGFAKIALITARTQPDPQRTASRALIAKKLNVRDYAQAERLATELGDDFVIDSLAAAFEAEARSGAGPFNHTPRGGR
jgi:hypothetical protein